MPESAPLARKALAFVVRREPEQKPTLLVYQHLDSPELPWRLPGGGLHADESPEAGLLRELREEVGDYLFQIVRKLGIQRYYKHFTSRNVERHDFLVRAGPMPNHFVHQDRDPDVQVEEFMRFQWLGMDSLDLIDDEHQGVLIPSYVPEWFQQ